MSEGTVTLGYTPIVALVIFIAASIWLGNLAQRVVEKGKFLEGYFLGNRGLGVWALALTATVQSGGTFMGFPSLVYSFGWVVALWIASYMVVPITGFGIIGKRIATISRRAGALTMPDLFRARYESPELGIICSLTIVVFMGFMVIAQFKSGALIMKLAMPGSTILAVAEDAKVTVDSGYYLGLSIFAVTVVGYTLIGGFLAAVWTDLFQSVMMLVGVLILLALALSHVGGLENATNHSLAETGAGYASGPGFQRDFLTVPLAFSMFILWPFTGIASPASVVRVMACKDTATLRKSIVVLCLYNMCIYLPIIVIAICARSVMPHLNSPDEAIPRMAIYLSNRLPFGEAVAALILSAPFGAVMATVSSYLVVMSSSVTRDVYHRFIRPRAAANELRIVAYVSMTLVGLGAMLAVIQPPKFLQQFVVLSTSGLGASFLAPLLMLCYWRRSTAQGIISAMVGGAATVATLYTIGTYYLPDAKMGPSGETRAFYLLGFDPIVWGIAVSGLAGWIVSLNTSPPSSATLSRFFDKAEPAATSPQAT